MGSSSKSEPLTFLNKHPQTRLAQARAVCGTEALLTVSARAPDLADKYLILRIRYHCHGFDYLHACIALLH